MFPIGDDQVKGGYKPVFTWVIIAINVIVFMYQLGLSETGLEQFFMTFATLPAKVMNGEQLYSLITSMFMHGGVLHIVGNMLFLYVFGDNVESRMGNFGFLLFYIVAGLLGSVAHILTDTTSMIPSLGASGAISGILGAYLVMFPGSRIKILDLRTMRTFLIGASQFLIYWIGLQVLTGFGSLASASEGGGVAYFAHIGGFAVGWVRGLMMKGKYTKGELDSNIGGFNNGKPNSF